MLKGLMFLTLFTSCFYSYSQNFNVIDKEKIYQFTMKVIVEEITVKRAAGRTQFQVSSSTREAAGGRIFRIIDRLTSNGVEGYIIDFNSFKNIVSYNTAVAKDAALVKTDYEKAVGKKQSDQDAYFFLTETDFENYVKVYESFARWQIIGLSSTVLPYKFRAGNGTNRYFEFGKDVTFGSTAGVSVFLDKDVSLSVLIGLGLTPIALSEENTDGFLTQSTTGSALTPLVGLTFDVKSFQIGLFTGWDHVPGPTGRKWIHQGLPWYSVGVGFQIFKFDLGQAKNRND